MPTTWTVERSHLLNVPEHIVANNFDHLRDQLLDLSESAQRPIYRLVWSFFDPVLNVGFIGDDGRKRRFMRLRKAA